MDGTGSGVIADVAALIGTILAAAYLVPQILRLRTSQDPSGVSGTWAALGVITNAAWVVYLLAAGVHAAIVAPLLAVLAYAATLGIVAQLDRRRAWVWASSTWAIALGALGLLGGAGVVGPILAATPAVQLTPAVVAVFRSRCPRGVSPTAWALGVVEATTWGLYGWLICDAALVGYGLVTSAGCLLILGRTLTTTTHQVPSNVAG